MLILPLPGPGVTMHNGAYVVPRAAIGKKLGVYGKAKLGTTFKWELKELGYDDDFVDEFTRNLLLHLSR